MLSGLKVFSNAGRVDASSAGLPGGTASSPSLRDPPSRASRAAPSTPTTSAPSPSSRTCQTSRIWRSVLATSNASAPASSAR